DRTGEGADLGSLLRGLVVGEPGRPGGGVAPARKQVGWSGTGIQVGRHLAAREAHIGSQSAWPFFGPAAGQRPNAAKSRVVPPPRAVRHEGKAPRGEEVRGPAPVLSIEV